MPEIFEKLYDIKSALMLMKDNGYIFTRASWKRQGINRVVMLLNGNDIAINLLNKYSKYALSEDAYNGLLLIDSDRDKYIFGWSPNFYDIITEDWIIAYGDKEE